MQSPPEMMPSVCSRFEALAERDPRRATRFAQRVLDASSSADAVERAWLRYALGWSLLCYERFGQAAVALSEAHAQFVSARHALGQLHCRYALLVARMMQQIEAGVVDAFAAVAMDFERAGLPGDAVRARLYQAVALNILGRPREAEAVLAEAKPEPSDAVARARWLRVAAATANGLANYEAAATLLEQATDMFTALGLRIDLAKCWYERGWLEQRRQALHAAQACYARAEALFERADLPLRRALCAKDRGFVEMRRGAYDASLAHISRALAYFRQLGRLRDIAGCQLHLGNIYVYTGRWEAALTCYARAEALFTELGVWGEQRIAMRNRALAYQQHGRWDEAAHLLAALEREVATHGNGDELAEVWLQRAELLVARGQRDEALTQLARAAEQFQRLGNSAFAAVCLLDQGWIRLESGDRRAARSLFQRAGPALQQHPHHLWRLCHGLARCAEAEGDQKAALEHYRAASELVRQLRRTLASEETSSGVYAQAASLHADSLRLAAALAAAREVIQLSEGQRALVLQRLLVRQPPPFTPDEQAQHDALRRRLLDLLTASSTPPASDAQLDEAIADYNALLLQARHRAPLADVPEALAAEFDLDQLRAIMGRRFGDDWTALVYVSLPERFLAVAVTPDSLTLESIAVDADLARLLGRATQPAYRGYTYRDLPHLQGQATRPWATLHALCERLIPPPVRARLHAGHRLLIVPAAQLHGLPWSALRLGDGWLAERAVLQLAPSLGILQALAARGSAAGNRALLIGCSAFGERAAELPGVNAELDAVAGELDPTSVTRLQDAAATRGQLLAASREGALAAYSLIHVASHAQLLPSRGSAAHLKLWDDELLLDEVARLRLDAEVVTLSTCDGAAADLLPGEEALSLSWGLLAGGARAVVASLWPVHDRAAQALMREFYQALLGGHDAGAALALAQRAAITRYAQNGDLVAEPQQWGSFVLNGWSMAREERRVVPPVAASV